jgi:16S rRNA C967 or C1407 C5-methylase (RsmB/RsmF family)/NOL1/NOP2/fmu family ribosome biogenesis protein
MALTLPQKFTQRIQQQLLEATPAFNEALLQPAPTSIRINNKKIFKELPYEKVPWSQAGYYLNHRPLFVFDPLWHSGAYYVQEASSMLVATVFKQLYAETDNINVLDLCAAPGGKTTLLASLLSENSLLVANEVIAARNSLLRENITRWGASNTVVTQNDAHDFQKVPAFFNAIFIDAPCSGEGLFRKEPEAVNEWSEANLALCAARQKRIVADVLPALKQGGYLIYSTCTYNPEENEVQIKNLIAEHDLVPIKISFNPEWGIVEDENFGLHCYPHKVKGEGFFINVLQKVNAENEPATRLKNKLNIISTAERNKLDVLLQAPENFEWINHKETFHFFPNEKVNLFNQLLQSLHIKMFGTAAAQIKQYDIIPQHDLALATSFNKNAFNRINVTNTEALKFLRKDNFEAAASQGWNIIQYNNVPLGFIKANQHRINNYYPVEWRIRKALGNEPLWSAVEI